jgi:hypothetical protein
MIQRGPPDRCSEVTDERYGTLEELGSETPAASIVLSAIAG